MNEKNLTLLHQRWYRSSDGVIAGVCRGLAEKMGVEVYLVRLAWLCAIFFFGIGLVLYLVAAFILPPKDDIERADQKKFLGVCFYLARRADLPVELVRLITVLLSLSSLGSSLLVYLLLYVFLVRNKTDLTGGPN